MISAWFSEPKRIKSSWYYRAKPHSCLCCNATLKNK